MTARIVTDPIPISVSAGAPFTVDHGLGRQVGGYLVIWADADVQVHVVDPDADSSKSLELVADTTCNLRLVLL